MRQNILAFYTKLYNRFYQHFFSISLFVFKLIMEGPFHLTKYAKMDHKFLRKLAAFLISSTFFSKDN
jgi:hypothetical protein